MTTTTSAERLAFEQERDARRARLAERRARDAERERAERERLARFAPVAARPIVGTPCGIIAAPRPTPPEPRVSWLARGEQTRVDVRALMSPWDGSAPDVAAILTGGFVPDDRIPHAPGFARIPSGVRSSRALAVRVAPVGLDNAERAAYVRDAAHVSVARRRRVMVTLAEPMLSWDYGERGERVAVAFAGVRRSRAAMRADVLRIAGAPSASRPRAASVARARRVSPAERVAPVAPVAPDVVRFGSIVGSIGNVE